VDEGASDIRVAWIGPSSPPNDWPFEQCQREFLIKRWSNISAWLDESLVERSKFERIVFSLSHRDRTATQAINAFHQNDPIQPMCVLLNDLWLGHRRSWIPDLQVPSFYWWNLQDQLLPWLRESGKAPKHVPVAWKLHWANDYWQQPAHSDPQTADSQLTIFLGTNAKNIAELEEVLQLQGWSAGHLLFNSDDPLKQLDQLANCSYLASQLESLLDEAQERYDSVRIWWCGSAIKHPGAELLSTSLISDLEVRLRNIQASRRVEFGWLTMLPDYDQWMSLYRVGFRRLLGQPYRWQGLLASSIKPKYTEPQVAEQHCV
jgi:hypothetical protein